MPDGASRGVGPKRRERRDACSTAHVRHRGQSMAGGGMHTDVCTSSDAEGIGTWREGCMPEIACAGHRGGRGIKVPGMHLNKTGNKRMKMHTLDPVSTKFVLGMFNITLLTIHTLCYETITNKN
jgi:hypothetical protein